MTILLKMHGKDLITVLEAECSCKCHRYPFKGHGAKPLYDFKKQCMDCGGSLSYLLQSHEVECSKYRLKFCIECIKLIKQEHQQRESKSTLADIIKELSEG